MRAVPGTLSSVIDFPLSRVRPASGSLPADAGEVIIFPGVRVERLIYDLSERPHAARGSAGHVLRQPDFEDY